MVGIFEMTDEQQERSLPKLLYIMGTARSGSTILEILLAHGEGVFGTGELASLVDDGFIGNKRCSCNVPFKQCKIWGKVARRLNLNNLQLQAWVDVQHKLDWHRGFLRQLFGNVSKSDKSIYARATKNLLAAIKAETNANVIVDSSKYAGRALALLQIVGLDIKVICLTRSPHGLMASFQKPNKDEQRPKSPFATLLYYLFTLASLRLTSFFLKDKVYFLTYEELVEDPVCCLDKLQIWSGIDLSSVKNILKIRVQFDVGHLVTGNRLRLQRFVQFQSPDKSKQKLFGNSSKFAAILMNMLKGVLRF